MRVTFDEFVLDTECHQLERNGEPVHLQPKAFRLLSYLIEAAPTALSRTHLYDLLWGETHVVEANLRNLVRDLRAVLDDSRLRPRFIKTVHGFGYRFVAHTITEVHPYHSGLMLDSGSDRFPLRQGPNLVGRDPGADVYLDHPDVSRIHAAIVVCSDEVWVENRSDGCQTLVGGDPISESVAIRVGQTVGIGPVTLTLRSRSSAARVAESAIDHGSATAGI